MSETNTPFSWFVVGFAASREGFNGECPYPALSSLAVCDRGSAHGTLDELLRDAELVNELSRLFEGYGGRK